MFSWKFAEPRQSLFSLFNSFFTVVIIPPVTFLGLVEVFGMHFSLISIIEEVKSAIQSVESKRDVVVKDSSH